MEPLLPRILPEGERKREEFSVLVGVQAEGIRIIRLLPSLPGYDSSVILFLENTVGAIPLRPERLD
jgi:hypothetical protein